MDLVSIVVPTFNRETRIIFTLQTLINQSYRNIEVIIVDDGSTDRSEKIISAYIDENKLQQRVYYYKKKNGGAPSARNYGYQRAKGKYLVFFDSDDLMLENRIAIQLRAIQEEKADCSACGFYYNSLEGFSYSPPNIVLQNILASYVAKILKGSTQSWMYSKVLIETINGYDESLVCYQDSDLTFRVLLQDPKIALIQKSLSIFIDHNGDERIMNSLKGKQSLDSICKYYGKIIAYSANILDFKLSILTVSYFVKSVAHGFYSNRDLIGLKRVFITYTNQIDQFSWSEKMILKLRFLIVSATELLKFVVKRLI
ncbi:glycosyltransferase family 2 protein [Dyadobacter arcticus]|uniref:Glycosyltransferase involved in cell wall biosynthesis n=1 Tax=Dyadobacter arcticus TaxID=1078754 RepID=A0ABX0US07_9BACT|nr:glycosyltransferase family 2 protein [Dyadobacter arcticus]NIJ54974.1 glycosyltransferase involved in cell wall biosynthesis [Dyadobacter arcticus]